MSKSNSIFKFERAFRTTTPNGGEILVKAEIPGTVTILIDDNDSLACVEISVTDLRVIGNALASMADEAYHASVQLEVGGALRETPDDE